MIQKSSSRSSKSRSSPRFVASTEASHTAQIALDHISPRAPTPFPEPHSQFSDLLHPSPPLRRRKGSNALREDIRNNPTTHSMMPNSGWTQDPFRGQIQDHAADNGEESNTYQTPTKHGKMPEARDSLDAFFGEEHDNTAKTDKYSDFSTIPETQVLKPKSSNLAKAHAVLGYGDGDEVVRKKSTTDLAASVKATPKKKFFRNFFKRKGSKEPTTPPSSSSGNTVGRKVISAPTLIDASPNAKALLNSASSLVKDSPSAKKVVNFSRPLTNRSTSDVSTGSPVGRGRSNTLAHGSSPFSGASTIPGEFTGKSGVIPGSPHTSRTKNVATEKKAGADDADSFDPSGHSGNENSARQTVAVPIILSRRTRQVDIPPRRRIYTAASGSGQLVGTTVTPCTLPLTDSEAEALGAQDAERYYRNASRSQTRRMNIAGDGPSIDPAYQNLVAKPANEIAANEMARIKAAREEVVSEAQAEVEHGLREEKQIHEMIKARMAARAAASGFVNGAEMPRIDYGEPDQSTALGASGPTNEERAHARALTASRTAG